MGSENSRYGVARPRERLALCSFGCAPSFRRVSQCQRAGVKAAQHRRQRGLALTQEPGGITVRSLPKEGGKPRRASPRPSKPALRGARTFPEEEAQGGAPAPPRPRQGGEG